MVQTYLREGVHDFEFPFIGYANDCGVCWKFRLS